MPTRSKLLERGKALQEQSGREAQGWKHWRWPGARATLLFFGRGPLDCPPSPSSVQFTCSVMSNSLWAHGLQHARLPCPSPTPRACWNSCPSSWWCHAIISSCHPLFLPLSIFPNIRVFSNESVLPIRWPKYWSFSFSISPSNEYSGFISFRIDWFDLLQSKGLSRVFSNTTVQKHQFFSAQLSLWSNSHIHTWLLEKP